MTADIGTKALGPSRFEDLLPHRESHARDEAGGQLAKPEPTWVTSSCLPLPSCVRFRQHPRKTFLLSRAEICSARACVCVCVSPSVPKSLAHC